MSLDLKTDQLSLQTVVVMLEQLQAIEEEG